MMQIIRSIANSQTHIYNEIISIDESHKWCREKKNVFIIFIACEAYTINANSTLVANEDNNVGTEVYSREEKLFV